MILLCYLIKQLILNFHILQCPIVSRIMDLDCMPGSSTRGKCNSHELRYLNQFRSSMLRSLEVSASSLSAYWLVSCTLHTIAHHDSSWNLLTASSRTLKDTFLGWYSALLNTTKGITYKKSVSIILIFLYYINIY